MSKFVRQPPKALEGAVWIAGGEVDEYHISLGFYGDDLDPAEISSRLGGIPTSKCAKGDVTLTNGARRIERTGRWLLAVPTHPGESLEPQLERLFGGLTHDLSIWQAFAERYKVRFVVSAWTRSSNRGLEISPALLRKIADRELSLGVDIYVDYDDDGVYIRWSGPWHVFSCAPRAHGTILRPRRLVIGSARPLNAGVDVARTHGSLSVHESSLLHRSTDWPAPHP